MTIGLFVFCFLIETAVEVDNRTYITCPSNRWSTNSLFAEVCHWNSTDDFLNFVGIIFRRAFKNETKTLKIMVQIVLKAPGGKVTTNPTAFTTGKRRPKTRNLKGVVKGKCAD